MWEKDADGEGKEARREAWPNLGEEFGECCGLQTSFRRLYVMLQKLQVINNVGLLVESMGFFSPGLLPSNRPCS